MSVAVVGLGNLILSDEGVGVHVVRRLAEAYDFPDGEALRKVLEKLAALGFRAVKRRDHARASQCV